MYEVRTWITTYFDELYVAVQSRTTGKIMANFCRFFSHIPVAIHVSQLNTRIFLCMKIAFVQMVRYKILWSLLYIIMLYNYERIV